VHAGLLQLGSRLTHLSIGSSRFRPVGFGLSAPWRNMPALQSLICGTGCNLELPVTGGHADNGSSDGSDSDDDEQHRQEGGSAGQAAAAAAAAPAQLLPALTSLLLEGLQDDPESLLMALAVDAPAACSQLQRLKLPRLSSSGYDDFGDQPAYVLQRHLPKLRGLQELDASVQSRSLDSLAVAVDALPALRGLTLLIDNAPMASAHPDDPEELLAAMLGRRLLALRPLLLSVPQQLHALKLVAAPGVVFDPAVDLEAAAQHISGLRQLSYTGPILALPGTGCHVSPGLLPSGLQGLTLLARQPGVGNSGAGMPFEAESKGFVFAGASLLTGLTSLRLGGMQTQWATADIDSACWLWDACGCDCCRGWWWAACQHELLHHACIAQPHCHMRSLYCLMQAARRRGRCAGICCRPTCESWSWTSRPWMTGAGVQCAQARALLHCSELWLQPHTCRRRAASLIPH
jgi:hypothetical protein